MVHRFYRRGDDHGHTGYVGLGFPGFPRGEAGGFDPTFSLPAMGGTCPGTFPKAEFLNRRSFHPLFQGG